ncbi:MAG: hypothetical protein RI897_2594 [Verrucomicrobiota bacterium]
MEGGFCGGIFFADEPVDFGHEDGVFEDEEVGFEDTGFISAHALGDAVLDIGELLAGEDDGFF